MRKLGAFAVLGAIYLLAAAIGNTFGQALTIFGFFMWMIAAGMVVYLVLFRDVKIDLFARSADDASEQVGDDLGVEDSGSDESDPDDVDVGNAAEGKDLPALRRNISRD